MPDALERDIERYVAALAERVDAGAGALPVAATHGPRRRRGRVLMAAALVLLAAAAAAVLTWPGDAPEPSPEIVDRPTSTTEPAPVPPEEASPWVPVTGVDLDAVEHDPHVVWTLMDFFVLYAENRGADPVGALVRPQTGEARALPAPPIGWRDAPTVVWTGREVLVIGGSSGEEVDRLGAAYDPMADAWREIAGPVDADAASVVFRDGVWNGTEVVFWQVGWAYDPTADRWRTFPRAPLSERTGAAVVAIGGDVVVWGGCEPVVDCYMDTETWLDDGALYSASTGEWTEIEDGPLDGAPFATAVSDGQTATVVALHLESDGDGADAVARFSPSEGWIDLPDPQAVPWYGSSVTQVGDAVVLAGPADGTDQWLVLRAGADRWEPIPRPQTPRRFHALADGQGHLLVAGGESGGPPEVLAVEQAWERQVPASLDIPVEVVEISGGPFARYVVPDDLPAATAYLTVYVDGRLQSRTSVRSGEGGSSRGTALQRGARVAVQIVAEDIDMLPLATSEPVILEPT